MKNKFFSRNAVVNCAFLFAFIFGLGFFFFNSENANAAQGTSITLSPATTRMEIKPGVHYEGVMKVTNSGTDSYDFEVSVAPYTVNGEDYDPNFTEKTDRTQIADWVSFPDGESFHAEANQTVEVNYQIDVPENALGGGQYAILFAETVPAVNSNTTGVSVGKRVGGLLFGKVEGDQVVDLSVNNENVVFWNKGNTIPVSFKAKNDGNTDEYLYYKTKVNNLFGQEKYNGSEKKNSVLPGTIRALGSGWDQAPLFGIYKVTEEILQKNANNETVKDFSFTRWAIVCPIWLLILIVSIILFIIILIVILKTRGNRKKKKQTKMNPSEDVNSNDSVKMPNPQNDEEYQNYLRWKNSQNQ